VVLKRAVTVDDAGDKRAAAKDKKYTDMAVKLDYRFIPFPLYTYGGMHARAIEFVNALVDAVEPAVHSLTCHQYKDLLMSHIAIAIQRGNAKIMMRGEQVIRQRACGALTRQYKLHNPRYARRYPSAVPEGVDDLRVVATQVSMDDVLVDLPVPAGEVVPGLVRGVMEGGDVAVDAVVLRLLGASSSCHLAAAAVSVAGPARQAAAVPGSGICPGTSSCVCPAVCCVMCPCSRSVAAGVPVLCDVVPPSKSSGDERVDVSCPSTVGVACGVLPVPAMCVTGARAGLSDVFVSPSSGALSGVVVTAASDAVVGGDVTAVPVSAVDGSDVGAVESVDCSDVTSMCVLPVLAL
jgi:hypothetical protein